MTVAIRDSDGTIRLRGDLTGAPVLYGPYTLAYNDPDIIADGVKVLAALPICQVLEYYIVIDTVWNSSDATTLAVGAGGTLAPPPDYDYTLIREVDAKAASQTGTGYVVDAAPSSRSTRASFLSTAGYLVAETPLAYSGTPPTAGSARIWALVNAP